MAESGQNGDVHLTGERPVPFNLSTTIEGSSCRISIDRVREGVILMRIDGHDVGEFGDVPMRVVEALISDTGMAMLFIDARGVRGVTVDVSGAWAQWLVRSRQRFSQMHMLTSSRQVEVTAEFVRRFTALHGQMNLYTDIPAFERCLIHASA